LKSTQKQQRFSAKLELTCLATHPNEDCIATGTNTGKIILWYNYLSSANNAHAKPTQSILHWHSLEVLSLCFTSEGSHLLSGGHECVLVKWLYKASGQKDFKPRLGAPLGEIVCSTDNTLYAIRHLDNCIYSLLLVRS
jgi:NET1-associated nuclear protein 1 (U3 small nucleolar RNA-associated protein 17)